MKSRSFRITGTAPLLLQSDTLADPICSAAKELKVSSGKRKKTDEDYEAMASIEWIANLYLDNGTIVVPQQNLVRMFLDGAKLSKRSKMIERGMIVLQNSFPLLYEGPTDLKALYQDKRFVDRRTVVVRQARVVRTRPIFPKWALEFSLSYDVEILDARDLDQILEACGKYIGLGNFRPRFGRFDVDRAGA